MASRYGEFLLLVLMALVATVATAVAIQGAVPGAPIGPGDAQYTTEVRPFVGDADNRTVVPYGDLTAAQRTEFDRAREGALTSEARPALIEYAGYPFLIEREGHTYEVLIRVYR